MKWLNIVFILLITFTLSCITIPQNKLEITHYAIEPEGDFSAADSSFDMSLKALPFTTGALYLGGKIVIRSAKGTTDYYYYHRWLAPPENMLRDIFTENMSQWKIYGKGVFQNSMGIVPSHEISCRLNKLDAVNKGQQSEAHLGINLTLTAVDPLTLQRTLILQKQYSYSESRDNEFVQSFISAVNVMTAQWLKDVRSDLELILIEESLKNQ